MRRDCGSASSSRKFNKFVTSKLLSSCLEALTKHGVAEHDIEVVRVPGAFELPLVAKTLAKSSPCGCGDLSGRGDPR